VRPGAAPAPSPREASSSVRGDSGSPGPAAPDPAQRRSLAPEPRAGWHVRLHHAFLNEHPRRGLPRPRCLPWRVAFGVVASSIPLGLISGRPARSPRAAPPPQATQSESYSVASGDPKNATRTGFAPTTVPAPRCLFYESPASGTGRARSTPREQRSDRSARNQGCPSPGRTPR
jgi:hypothetical protein